MTMVVTLANRDYVFLLSDRRLSLEGAIIDDDWGKSGTIIFPKGRFAFGFCGIAKASGLDIRRWILDSLYNSAPPDYEILKTFERFKNLATDFFNENSVLKTLDPSVKRLSIIFSGYLCFHNPPMIGCAIISNYQDPKKGKSSINAWDKFESSYTNEKKPRVNQVSLVMRIGAYQAIVIFHTLLNNFLVILSNSSMLHRGFSP